jgi:integrase
VFQEFGGDRFRTAITQACTAAGVPALSPHDLRHRRISLMHLGETLKAAAAARKEQPRSTARTSAKRPANPSFALR